MDSPQASLTAASEMRAQNRMLVLLALAAFASAANLRICDPLLPQIAGEFAVTVGTSAAVVTAFAVSYGVAQIIVGPMGDARGKIAVIAAGCLWVGIQTALCAAMPSLSLLVVTRFLAGAGAAAVIPLSIAWIGDTVPYEQRQPVLARFLSGQILGIVFGQAAGGVLGEWVGWRGTMLVISLMHLAAGLLLWSEMRRAGFVAGGTGEARWKQSAISALRVLQVPWVRIMLATVFFEGFAMFGAFAFVGAELHERFGVSLGVVGLLLAALGLGAFAYVLNAGWLVRKLGQHGLVAWGSILIATGYVVLAVMPVAWLAVPAIAIIGLGFYMFHNTLQTNATQMAPEARGLAMSLFAFTLFTSQSAGVALAAPVVDRFGARPVFFATAVLIVAVAFWFRARLLRRASAGSAGPA